MKAPLVRASLVKRRYTKYMALPFLYVRRRNVPLRSIILLPPPRPNSVTSRFRSYDPTMQRPSTCTKRMQHGLSHYQLRLKKLKSFPSRFGHGSGPSTGRVGLGWVGSQNFPSLVMVCRVGSGPLSKISNKYASELVLDEHILYD